jgi:hypothetical protein
MIVTWPAKIVVTTVELVSCKSNTANPGVSPAVVEAGSVQLTWPVDPVPTRAQLNVARIVDESADSRIWAA